MRPGQIEDILMNFSVLSQIAVLLFIIFLCVRSNWKRGPVIARLFFLFTAVTFLLSDLYYITHIWIKDTPYLPFSAEDISAVGMYLLFAASLRSNFYEDINREGGLSVWGILLGAANAALWAIWSGNILRSIVEGAAFCYFLSAAVWAVKREKVYPKGAGIALTVVSFAVFPAEAVLYYLPDSGARTVLDVCCYTALYFVFLYLILRTAHGLLEVWDADRVIASSWFTTVWGLCTLYLSEEPLYSICDLLITASLVLNYYSLRRKDREMAAETAEPAIDGGGEEKAP